MVRNNKDKRENVNYRYSSKANYFGSISEQNICARRNSKMLTISSKISARLKFERRRFKVFHVKFLLILETCLFEVHIMHLSIKDLYVFGSAPCLVSTIVTLLKEYMRYLKREKTKCILFSLFSDGLFLFTNVY